MTLVRVESTCTLYVHAVSAYMYMYMCILIFLSIVHHTFKGVSFCFSLLFLPPSLPPFLPPFLSLPPSRTRKSYRVWRRISTPSWPTWSTSRATLWSCRTTSSPLTTPRSVAIQLPLSHPTSVCFSFLLVLPPFLSFTSPPAPTPFLLPPHVLSLFHDSVHMNSTLLLMYTLVIMYGIILRLVTLSIGERRPLPCINFKDSACPAELPRWLSW